MAVETRPNDEAGRAWLAAEEDAGSYMLVNERTISKLTGDDLPPSSPAPDTLPARKFWTAIYDQGLMPAVQTLKSTLPERDRIIMETATEFHRSHPKVLEMAAAIGVTEAQIEDLFTYGATLE